MARAEPSLFWARVGAWAFVALIPVLGFWMFDMWFIRSIGSMFYRSWDEWARWNRYGMVYTYPAPGELYVRENGGEREPLDAWMARRQRFRLR